MTSPFHRGAAGFTLAEVMISLLLVTMLIAALVQSIMVGRSLTYSNAQRVAAFGMCKAKLEEMRGMDYTQLVTTNFADEADLRFAHLSGAEQIPITCARTVELTPQTDPERTDVSVQVDWNYRGVALVERVDATVYPR